MNTLILVLALLVVSVAAAIVFAKTYNDGLMFSFVMIASVLGGIALSFFLIITFATPKSIALFERQKAYVETLAPDTLENAGAIIIKNEQNEWLFKAQYSYERFGNWSVYPKTILLLEPID